MGAQEMLCILIWVTVTWVQTQIKIHRAVHICCVTSFFFLSREKKNRNALLH